MPNHVTNIIKLEGDRLNIQKLLETICSDEFGVGTIDFNKVIPMPESLGIESGSRTNCGLQAYKEFVSLYKILHGDNADLLNIPQKSERAFLRQRKDIPEDEWELGRIAFKNILRYDFADWYDWRIANWGTKWGAYGYQEGFDYSRIDSLKFLTAWSAPHPVIEKIAEMFPEIEITHEWADEDIGMNCGRKIYQDGADYEEYYPESEVERIVFAARIMDIDPSEYGLFLNASGTGYVRFPDDEFEKIEIMGQVALFTNERLTDKDIPKGFYSYHLRESDDGDTFAALEKYVAVNHSGTVITLKPIALGEKGYIHFDEDNSPNFLGESCLLEELGGGTETEETESIEQTM